MIETDQYKVPDSIYYYMLHYNDVICEQYNPYIPEDEIEKFNKRNKVSLWDKENFIEKLEATKDYYISDKNGLYAEGWVHIKEDTYIHKNLLYLMSEMSEKDTGEFLCWVSDRYYINPDEILQCAIDTIDKAITEFKTLNN